MQRNLANTSNTRRGVQDMDDWDKREELCTERCLLCDETEERPESATGTTNDVDKPDGDIVDLVADDGQDEKTVRGTTEAGDLNEIIPYPPNERRSSVSD